MIAYELNLKKFATPMTDNLEFLADVGYVSPLVYNDTQKKVEIKLFRHCDEIQQGAAAQFLCSHWSSEIKCESVEQAKEYILKNFSASNLFYLLLFGGKCIGCVGIDRKNFYPFLSHLYVQQSWRSKGFAKALLQFAEAMVISYGFNEVRIWCEPHLQKFYENMSWKQENVQDGLLIMKKKLENEQEGLIFCSSDLGGYASNLF